MKAGVLDIFFFAGFIEQGMRDAASLVENNYNDLNRSARGTTR
jgi:hypothetical protein